MIHVLVAGGGLAGLATALSLSDAGCRVTLLESMSRFGGRTCSYSDRVAGDEIDNGQHILMGCCDAALRYVHRIGSASQLRTLPGLSLQFRHCDGRVAKLAAGRLPHPFGMLQGVLRFSMLSLAERLSVLRVAMHLRSLTSTGSDALDQLDAASWLRSLRQSDTVMEYLWTPIVLATMNTVPDRASAHLLAVVLRRIFFSSADAAAVLLPERGLSHLFVHPAVTALRQAGAVLVRSDALHAIVLKEGGTVACRMRSGSVFEADALVSALPAWKLNEVLHRSGLEKAVDCDLSSFEPSPILSAHVWLSYEAALPPMMGLFGCSTQWVFDKGASVDGYRRVSCTISAAEDLMELDNESLRKLLSQELRQVIPGLREDDILRVLPMRERKATFVPRNGLEWCRPGPRSSLRPLYLAGDWTNTGLPATIESAVLSGEHAAAALLEDASSSRTMLRTRI